MRLDYKLSAKDIRLLYHTVTKWKQVLEGKIPDKGRANCPLCKKFNEIPTHYGHNPIFNCQECPIKIATKKPGCRGTPYLKWHTHHLLSHPAARPYSIRCKKCQKYAQQMLDFLLELIELSEKL